MRTLAKSIAIPNLSQRSRSLPGQTRYHPCNSGLVIRSGSLGFSRARWISLAICSTVDRMNPDDGWRRIPEALSTRMGERGATKTQIVRRGGVDWGTINKLLSGEPVRREDALWRVAEFLGWQADAFDRIRRGDPPIEATPNRSEIPTGSDLGEALGVPGRMIEDRLTAIEDRLDALEHTGTVTPIDTERASKRASQRDKSRQKPKSGAKGPTNTPTGWAYAASRDDGQPDTEDLSGIETTSHRPTRKTFDPDTD